MRKPFKGNYQWTPMERKQIFASKYLTFLPSEEELRVEIEKERKLIEAVLEDKDDNE